MKVLFNDLILFRARSGIAGYTSELLRGLSDVPGVEINRVSETGAGKVLRRASQAVLADGAKASPLLKRVVKGMGRPVLSNVASMAFRFSKWPIYHEPDSLPLDVPATTVVTVHDLSVLLFPEFHPAHRVSKYERDFRRALPRISAFVAVSDATKRDLIKVLGVAEEKIHVIPEAPRRPFQDRPVTPSKKYFLYVGTLEPRKNLARLLQAYRLLPEKVKSQYPLYLIGGWGWKSDEIRKELEKTKGAKHLGFVEDEELVGLLSGATALVYPSVYEGFGLPPLEAMACGVPVITTRAGGLAETVGDSASFVEPEDVHGIAEAMLEIAEDREFAETLRMKGLARASLFSWARTADLTAQLYARLVG